MGPSEAFHHNLLQVLSTKDRRFSTSQRMLSLLEETLSCTDRLLTFSPSQREPALPPERGKERTFELEF